MERTTLNSLENEETTQLPSGKQRPNPFLSILGPKDESKTFSELGQLQQQPFENRDPLLHQLSPQADPGADGSLTVPRQKQDPLLRQLNPQADPGTDVDFTVPHQRQNPLLHQLNPQDDPGVKGGLNVPHQRQNPLLHQLNPKADPVADGGLNVPPQRQNPLLNQLNPKADPVADEGLSVPRQRQNPLLNQLNPQADPVADGGLSVPRQRQNPLLNQLNPQADPVAAAGLSVPRQRQDPLLRGLPAGSQESTTNFQLELPQATTRKISKDEESNDDIEITSLSPAGGRKQDPLHRARLPTGSPGDDLAAVLGTTESSSNSGTFEQLRLATDEGNCLR